MGDARNFSIPSNYTKLAVNDCSHCDEKKATIKEQDQKIVMLKDMTQEDYILGRINIQKQNNKSYFLHPIDKGIAIRLQYNHLEEILVQPGTNSKG